MNLWNVIACCIVVCVAATDASTCTPVSIDPTNVNVFNWAYRPHDNDFDDLIFYCSVSESGTGPLDSEAPVALNSGLYDGFLFYVIIYSPEV